MNLPLLSVTRKSTHGSAAAAFFAVAVIFLSDGTVWARTLGAKKDKNSVSAKSTIETAQDLLIRGQRLKAIEFLTKAIEKEKPGSVSAKELQQTLRDISTVFTNEKAQQVFEQALTWKSSDLSQALNKINEALKIEEDNAEITSEAIRILIAQGECTKAEGLAQKALQMNPKLEALILANVQVAVCNGKLQGLAFPKQENSLSDLSLAPAWLMIEVELKYKTSQFGRARDLIQQAKQQFPDFPEPFYWEWRLGMAEKLKNQDSANKYLQMCKTISQRKLRLFVSDPLLCRRLSEVESFFKKHDGETID